MTYGVLDLTGQTLAIVAIVAVLMLIGASFLHAADYNAMAFVIQFFSFIPLMILIVTWLTELNSDWWNELGPLPIVGVVIIGAIAIFGPPYVGDLIDDVC